MKEISTHKQRKKLWQEIHNSGCYLTAKVQETKKVVISQTGVLLENHNKSSNWKHSYTRNNWMFWQRLHNKNDAFSFEKLIQ